MLVLVVSVLLYSVAHYNNIDLGCVVGRYLKIRSGFFLFSKKIVLDMFFCLLPHSIGLI